MRLYRLHLLAYGAFTDRLLDFGESPNALIVVHGENETGKSTTLNAMTDLRFGFETRSAAGFLHPYPKLQVGGEFIDEAGQRHALIRRKGRGSTLMQADFGSSMPMKDAPASAAVERSLTQGFDRQSYLQTFGLDRDRMVKGGQELFRAEGDIGALLFEASTGAGSLSDITRQLEADSRKLYSGSSNVRNALINQALQKHRKLVSEYASAGVLPSEWKRLNRTHEDARERWNTLLHRQKTLNASLNELLELRLVLTQLKQLDHERSVLAELESIPLLEESAAAELNTWQSSLKQLDIQIGEARREMEEQQERLEALQTDDAILGIRSSVQRVVSSADTLSKRYEDLSRAQLAVERAETQLSKVASAIDASRTAGELVALIPSRSLREDFNERLQKMNNAQAAMEMHEQAGQHLQDEADDRVEFLPAQDKLAIFDAARAAVARHESSIQRLALIPRELQSARRTLQQMLTEIGLDKADALNAVQVLSDTAIDEQVQWASRLRATDEALSEEKMSLERELADEEFNLQSLLDQGLVATLDDVQAARSARERYWSELRAQYIDNQDSPADITARVTLAESYYDSVIDADKHADAVAIDTARATRVQQSQRMISKLQTELDSLARRLAVVKSEDDKRQAQWETFLAMRSLPRLPGAELREWQARVKTAGEQAETVFALVEEKTRLEVEINALSDSLRTAVIALEITAVADNLPLAALVSLAETLHMKLRKREEALNVRAVRQAERRKARARRKDQEEELRQLNAESRQSVLPVFEYLLLSAESSVATARERLNEFIELDDCNRALIDAQQQCDTLKSEIDTLLGGIEKIRKALMLSEGDDPQLFCERLERRLDTAERLRGQQLDAQGRLDRAQETLKAARKQSADYRESIERLCLKAEVNGEQELPGRIAESARKRDAQLRLEEASSRLSSSSTRDENSLRELLGGREEAQLEIEIAQCEQELQEIDDAIEQSREQLEAAKHDLDRCDGSASAAQIAEEMQQTESTIVSHLPTWIRLKLADTLLKEATALFREKAQAPMFDRASGYFSRITDGQFIRLGSIDEGKGPALIVTRHDGGTVGVNGLSEGTLDQLYLSLRLAAVDLRRRGGVVLPLVLDDVLMSSDEKRTSLALAALAEHAVDNQIILLTHHRHVMELASKHVPAERLVSLSL